MAGRRRGDNLHKIKLDERFNSPSAWLHGVSDRIVIRQRQAVENRRKFLEELGKPPEPGRGLDGYPLQEPKGVPKHE